MKNIYTPPCCSRWLEHNSHCFAFLIFLVSLGFSAPAAAQSCSSDTECNDGLFCTADQCIDNLCTYPPSETICDDGITCTQDFCFEGGSAQGFSCLFTPQPSRCDDENSCTDDICMNTPDFPAPASDPDPVTGCSYSPHCYDVDLCTVDSCVEGTCLYPQVDCEDGSPCSVDFCFNDICIHDSSSIPNGTPCTSDSIECTLDECAFGVCTHLFLIGPNSALSCNDGNPCTIDRCLDSMCVHTNMPNGVGCNGDSDACTADSCRNGICVVTLRNCSDNNLCTVDRCINGVCSHFIGFDCNDNIDCTSDACDLGTGACRHTTNDLACDDNLSCTTEECSPFIGCVYLSICTDFIDCTDDICGPGSICHFIENDAYCNDNVACTEEYCAGTFHGCQYQPDPDLCYDGYPCTDDFCTPFVGCTYGDSCFNVNCVSDADCEDGIFCTDDVCDVLGCRFVLNNGNCPDDGLPCTVIVCYPDYSPNLGCIDFVRCDDGIDCTNDFCDFDDRGRCVHQTVDGACDDGLSCTDQECSPIVGCIYRFACLDDGVDCTDDLCVSPGTCIYVPNNANCNDGNPVTLDICHQQIGCITTLSSNPCFDGIDCTFDQGTAGNCIHEPIHTFCNDNSACTDNICNPATGCVSTPKNCDDSDNCTEDLCLADGTCQSTEHDCEEGDPCTRDVCFATTEGFVCDHIFDCRIYNGENCCDDNNACTDDVCSSNGKCVYRSVTCNDNAPGTSDACNPATGCVAVLNCSQNPLQCCDDGSPCTIDECVALPCASPPCAIECRHTPIDCDDCDICTADFCEVTSSGRASCKHQRVKADAGPNRIVYKGYTSAYTCATLTVAVTGGTPGYTYKWSTGQSSASITVCPASDKTYCVTVTDASGCKDVDCVEVCLWDIRCNSNKVQLCHKNTNGSTSLMCVSSSLVAGHLAHGDQLGYCGQNPCHHDDDDDDGHDDDDDDGRSSKLAAPGEQEAGATPDESRLMLNAYPNPFNETLNIEFSLPRDSKAKLEILDISGKQVALLFEGDITASELRKVEFTPGAGSDGMIIYRLQTEEGTYYGKAVMVR